MIIMYAVVLQSRLSINEWVMKFVPSFATDFQIRLWKKLVDFKISCPKCGSCKIVKKKNQERHCTQCGEIFYVVTPSGGSQMDQERYSL